MAKDFHGMANEIKENETYKSMKGEEKELIDKAIAEIEKLNRQVFGLKQRVSNLEIKELKKDYVRHY